MRESVGTGWKKGVRAGSHQVAQGWAHGGLDQPPGKGAQSTEGAKDVPECPWQEGIDGGAVFAAAPWAGVPSVEKPGHRNEVTEPRNHEAKM